MNYSLLTEPWIRVTRHGVEEKVGLRQFFENAKEYDDVLGLKSLETSEYEIYRFLIAVFMDAYRERLAGGFGEDAFSIYEENEGFDKDLMNQYFDQCVEEGSTFDLLDEERPFFQSTKKLFCTVKDAEHYPAEIICNDIATASNTPFYGKIPDGYNLKGRSVSYDGLPLDEVAYWLIDKCCWMFGAGNGAIVNGPLNGECTTILVKGRNAFETILLNSEEVPEDAGLPLWRSSGVYPDNLDILTGMFAPTRGYYPDLESVDEENKVLKGMYVFAYKPVLVEHNLLKKQEAASSKWASSYDPHVVLRKIKKDNVEKEVPAKFSTARRGFFRICNALGMVGEDLKSFSQVGKLVYSKNVRKYSERMDEIREARIAIYSSTNSWANITWSDKEDSGFVDFGKELYEGDIAYLAYTIGRWDSSIGKYLTKKKSAIDCFDDGMVALFDDTMKRALQGQNVDELLDEVRQSVWKIGLEAFQCLREYYHCDKVCGSFVAKGAKQYYEAESNFKKAMRKILKEREDRNFGESEEKSEDVSE